MAQKRMLNKSISLSRKANRLSLKYSFIYTWCIPHTDDWGNIEKDPYVLKGMCFPLKKEITPKDITDFITVAQIKDEKDESLITEYEDCIQFNNFEDHQTISVEKRAKSKFSLIPKNPQESPRNPQIREVKLREDNLSKDKRIYGEFQNVLLTFEEYEKLIEKISEKNTHILIEELSSYLASKGKKYSSHYATILTWARRKVSEHQSKLLSKTKTIA